MRYSDDESDHLHSHRNPRPGPPRQQGEADPVQIAQYAESPAAQARNVKALTGVDAFRLRVQNFRVLFHETADTITILDIGPRGGITTRRDRNARNDKKPPRATKL